ncbi:putative NB-ARC protein [Tanacetum coccineum]
MNGVRSLLQIQGVLTDASQEEITNQSVKRWLNDLQHLGAYNIDDLLNDLTTEAIYAPVVGRQEEKDELIHKLLQHDNEACNENFSAVPILSIGGVGAVDDAPTTGPSSSKSPGIRIDFEIQN